MGWQLQPYFKNRRKIAGGEARAQRARPRAQARVPDGRACGAADCRTAGAARAARRLGADGGGDPGGGDDVRVACHTIDTKCASLNNHSR